MGPMTATASTMGGVVGLAVLACLVGKSGLAPHWRSGGNVPYGQGKGDLQGRASAVSAAHGEAVQFVVADQAVESAVPPISPLRPLESKGGLSLDTTRGVMGLGGSRSLDLKLEYNISYDDLAVGIVTSSATMHKRLPVLVDAWAREAPFPVFVVTDAADPLGWRAEGLDVRTSDCSPQINGLICKTRKVFEIMSAEFMMGETGRRKWFLRLMDDTLVVKENLLHVLRRLDPEKPWCVGNRIGIEKANFSYFQGGAGWGVSGAALESIASSWSTWDNIILAGGESPMSPGFTAVSTYADDLLWGVFIANLGIPAVGLDGWSGAPLDVKAGVVPCDEEIKKTFCFRSTFPVGTWADGSQALSTGACRTNITRIAVVHMGLEVWGGRDPWSEQMADVSRVFAGDSEDIVANFEDSPYMYWRLCSKSGRRIEVVPRPQLYQDILHATRSKRRLHEQYDAMQRMRKLYIGLCQQPSDVLSLVPGYSADDTFLSVVMGHALERLRDHMRMHIRPWVFNLAVGGNRETQVVYRLGDDATKVALEACRRVNLTEQGCMDFTIAQMQAALPPELHYHNLCVKTRANLVEPSQYQEDAAAADAAQSHSRSASQPAARATDPTITASSLARHALPVAELVEKERRELGERKGWRLSPILPCDVAVAVISSATDISGRLPVLEASWISSAPFDVIVVTDISADVRGRPFVHKVNCSSSDQEGVICKTTMATELLHNLFPNKKWYLRVSDTALVVPSNLLYHLQFLSLDTPICAGEVIVTQGISVTYLTSGPGWALNHAAMRVAHEQLDVYRTMALSPTTSLPFAIDFAHLNVDDFVWGVFLRGVGVTAAQAGGWSAAPLDVTYGTRTCHNVFRSSAITYQRVSIGRSASGNVVGLAPGRVVLDRPAVVDMARQAGSYTKSGEAWVDEMEQAGHLLQYESQTWAAGYEDEPYHYWRLCRMVEGSIAEGDMPQDLVREIVHNAGLNAQGHAFELPMQTVHAPVALCMHPKDIVEPVCRRSFLDATACSTLEGLVEYKRDQLRKRAPRIYVNVSMSPPSATAAAKSITAVYRVGDEPMLEAKETCMGAGLKTKQQLIECITRVVEAVEARLPPGLRYEMLCGQHSKRRAETTKEDGEPSLEGHHAPASVKEDDLVGPAETWSLDQVERLRSYIRGGHIDLTVTSPLNGSVHAAGRVVVHTSCPIVTRPDLTLEVALGREVNLRGLEAALRDIVHTCIALDGRLVRCLSVFQYGYNLWVTEPGFHKLTAWVEDRQSGDVLPWTRQSVTFTVSPVKTQNPFAQWCSVPFTQRGLLMGRMQRLEADEGELSFDGPCEQPLEIFLRLSPRRDDPQDGVTVVMLSTMSLIKSLRELHAEQRRVTTLRIFLNGFAAGSGARWREWFMSKCQTLDLAGLHVDLDCPSGNMESYLYMKSKVLSLPESSEHAIILLLEDDYLLQPTAILEMVEIFASHNPCVVIPYDGGERYLFREYNEDDGKITVVAGRRRHWRTTRSTTVTFCARLGTMRHMDSLGILMHPKDDYFNSGRVVDAGANIVLPMPGLAAHIENVNIFSEPFMPLYFNYYQYARELKREAVREGLLWKDVAA